MGIDESPGADQQRLQGAGAVQVAGAQRNFREPAVAQGEQPGQAPGGIDLPGCEGGQGGAEVEVDHLQVFLAETDAGQGIVERQLAGGATKDAYALALEILQGLDPGPRLHAEIVVDPSRGSGQQTAVQASGLADDRRQVAEVGEVHLAVGERFVDHRAGALEEAPFHRDAVVGEFLLQQLPGVEHVDHAATRVRAAGTDVRHRDADFLRRSGARQRHVGTEQAGEHRRGEQTEQGRRKRFHGAAPWNGKRGIPAGSGCAASYAQRRLENK